ncbi:MAG: leucine-rich repeat domain-containing protein [Prevotella sp.]|nr:leucine-rich repeat domain-containing protein [Prevotella sp.]
MKKQFLLLLLMLAGGVNVVLGGTRNYQVVYTGRTTSQGAGYTVQNTQLTDGSITSGYDAETLVTYRNGTGYNSNPTALSTQNIGNYIKAREVTDYDASITVSTRNAPTGYYGVITIAYSPKTVRYRVLYEMSTLPGAGYTLTGSNPTNGRITSAADATVLEIQKTGTDEIPTLTTANVSNYIQARPISGYTTSYYVNTNEAQLGYLGNIYVNYVASTAATVTTDGVWDYSNRYYRTTGTEIILPDDECAISLHLTAEEVTETKTYYRYRYDDNYGYSYYTNWYYFDLNGSSLINRSNNSDAANLYPLADDGTTRLNNSTTTVVDSDNEFGDNVVYRFVSMDNNWEQFNTLTDGTPIYRRAYTYNVTRTIGTSHVKNAVIPQTAPDGRKVVAIQKWGLCYKQEDVEEVFNCEVTNNIPNPDNITYHGRLVDDHSNWYLETVTFESPSNLRSIGDYAFMSCKKLTSVKIPNTVEFLGQGAFEMDTKLTDVEFQKADDGSFTTKIKTIKNFTFWLCTSLPTLELPDGITEIEGQRSGASLQYLTSLTTLRLPNTLERIGPHFLCSCSSLKMLTIPVSVKYIDGASFHGCESLESVYILGPAAALQGEYAEGTSGSSSSTFSANETLCKEAVSKCTFYTTSGNLEGYVNDPVWSRINENGVYDPENGKFGNWLTAIPDTKRTLMPNVWVTALFPYGQENYADVFGEGTLVAVMDQDKTFKYSTQSVNGKATRVYNIEFKLLEGDGIPANLPLLIKPAHQTEYTFYEAENTIEDYFKTESTKDHGYSANAEDGAVITMKGRYLDYKLFPWDFYFMYKNKTEDGNGGWQYDENEVAKFYRVPDADHAATIRACRCYWSISVDGLKTDGGASTSNAKLFNPNPTGIEDVEAEAVSIGIYDLQGRKLDVAPEELPAGIFIVNGKKVAIK